VGAGGGGRGALREVLARVAGLQSCQPAPCCAVGWALPASEPVSLPCLPLPPHARSKLQQAVKLLPQHIKSLPKRVNYMRKLVESEGLPAGERLDLVARLMLDMRWAGAEGGLWRAAGAAKPV
jgi:hypothetical protein